jgi:hypothetical protein
VAYRVKKKPEEFLIFGLWPSVFGLRNVLTAGLSTEETKPKDQKPKAKDPKIALLDTPLLIP